MQNMARITKDSRKETNVGLTTNLFECRSVTGEVSETDQTVHYRPDPVIFLLTYKSPTRRGSIEEAGHRCGTHHIIELKAGEIVSCKNAQRIDKLFIELHVLS